MNNIFIWLGTICTFLLGYFLGKGSFTKETYQAIKKELAHKVLPQFRQPSGVVQRPSAARLNELHHPEILEEKEEMRRSLQEEVKPLTPVI
jgi:hypothetical protein